jgi:hypothetical protein
MNGHRYFGTVAAYRGTLVVRRDDDGPHAFMSAREAAKASVGLQAGDRVEFSIAPGGAAVDVMLCAYSGKRHRTANWRANSLVTAT